MLGNPQNLRLLLDAVESDESWPATRSDLFDRATRVGVREANELRATSDRVPQARVLDAAGEIFAALLLSGAEGVDRIESSDRSFPFLNSFIGFSEIDRQAAIETRLFRRVGGMRFIPAHRTVAEYLGSRCLGQRLRAGLSARRLTSVVAPDGHVRADLRTLHAWLAFFGGDNWRRAAIERDPYGILRYGDPAHFSPNEKRRLLTALKAIAEDDPYFREAEGWTRPFIAEFFTDDMGIEVLGVINNPNRKYHLSTLLLEAMAGTGFAERLHPELLQIADDEDRPYGERADAVAALSHLSDNQWACLVDRLRRRRTENSALLSLEIISRQSGAHFTAELVGDSLADAALCYSGHRSADLRADFKHVVRRLDASLIHSVLDQVAARMQPMCKGRFRHDCTCALAVTPTLLHLVERRVSGNPLPRLEPDDVWRWLRNAYDRSHGQSDRALLGPLRSHKSLRRAIQNRALSDEAYEDSPWMRIYRLRDVFPELALSEDDIAFHMTAAAGAHNARLWSDLVRASGPDRRLRLLARNQAKNDPRLMAEWARMRRHRRASSRERGEWSWKRQERRLEQRRVRALQSRRDEFESVRNDIVSGHHHGWLISIAQVYLGHDRSSAEKSPRERLAKFIGGDLLDSALEGLKALLTRPDVPTLDRLAEESAKSCYLPIEFAVCAGVIAYVHDGGSLESLPVEILEAARGSHFYKANFSQFPKILQDVENILLSSDDVTEQFMRRFLEPKIEAGLHQIEDLEFFTNDNRLAFLAARLPMEWLQRFPDLPSQVARHLLMAGIAHGDRTEVHDFVLKRCIAIENSWPNGPPTRAAMEARSLWCAAEFLLSPGANGPGAAFVREHPYHLASVRSMFAPSVSAATPWPRVTIRQNAFLLEHCCPDWNAPDLPRDGRRVGEHDEWETHRFLRQRMADVATSDDSEAGKWLDSLIANPSLTRWHDELRHLRAGWRKRRREATYRAPDFEEVRSFLENKGPVSVEDLEAMMLEELERLQEDISNGDSAGWPPYWCGGQPYDENTCRDQIMARLRPFFELRNVQLRPECRMPEDKRSDIVATLILGGETYDLPIEVKGQWHKELWIAAVEQLDRRYARYKNARGRGVYLVLWFGKVPNRNLPPRADGADRPPDHRALSEMLENDLPEELKGRISIFVLDVSRPR